MSEVGRIRGGMRNVRVARNRKGVRGKGRDGLVGKIMARLEKLGFKTGGLERGWSNLAPAHCSEMGHKSFDWLDK